MFFVDRILLMGATTATNRFYYVYRDRVWISHYYRRIDRFEVLAAKHHHISYTAEAESLERQRGETSDKSWVFYIATDLAVTETAVQILNKRRFIDYLQQ